MADSTKSVLACLWNKFTSLLNNISINYLHLSIKWDSMVSEEIVVISYTVYERTIFYWWFLKKFEISVASLESQAA